MWYKSTTQIEEKILSGPLIKTVAQALPNYIIVVIRSHKVVVTILKPCYLSFGAEQKMKIHWMSLDR